MVDPNAAKNASANATPAAVSTTSTGANSVSPAATTVISAPPTIPPFVYDPAKPHSAALWFAQLSISFRLHPCSAADKVALTLNALDSSTFEKVARALLPADIETFADYDVLKATMVSLFDTSESIFARRYALFQTEWKGPEHEPIAEFCSRVRESVSAIDPANFGETAIQTMVLLMAMKHPALEVFRIQVLNLLNKDPATTLKKCQETMTATYQTQREQQLPVGTSVNFVRKTPSGQSNRFSKREEKERYSSCDSCGGQHNRNSCRFRDAECRFCNEVGHIEKVCRKKNNNRNSFSGSSFHSKSDDRDRRRPRVGMIRATSPSTSTAADRYSADANYEPFHGRPNIRYVRDESSARSAITSSNAKTRVQGYSDIRVSSVRLVNSVDTAAPANTPASSGRPMIEFFLDDQPMTAQLDTGSDVTILSMEDYKRMGKPAMYGPTVAARAVNNSRLPLLGSFKAPAQIDGHSQSINFNVAEIKSSLLGLDFFHAFKLHSKPLDSILC